MALIVIWGWPTRVPEIGPLARRYLYGNMKEGISPLTTLALPMALRFQRVGESF